MRLRRVTAAAVVGLAAAAAAGCSGTSPAPQGGPSTAGTTAPAVGATAPAAGATAPGTRSSAAGTVSGSSAVGKTMCKDSPSAAVGQALGLAVGPVVATDEGRVTVCAYTGRYEVLVRYQTDENASQFAVDRQSAVRLHQEVTAVTGLGEQAFWAASPPSYTLAARNNDNMAIFITAPAALSSMRILMVQLLEKI
jgi:hypothetical protein